MIHILFKGVLPLIEFLNAMNIQKYISIFLNVKNAPT